MLLPLTRLSAIKMTKSLLMCFDFDNTIINENSDVIVRDMYDGDLSEDIKKSHDGHWTAYMRSIFHLLHKNGVKPNSVIDKVNSIPAIVGMNDLMKNLHTHECDVIIISDANLIFIDSWLNHNGLRDTVSKIYTNPAWFDDNDLLHIEEYHDQDWCKLSEKNLCKGYVLENFIKEQSEAGVKYDKVAYAGDGRNDFCPMLRLSEKDIVFPRKDHYIMKLINNCSKGGEYMMKAQIVPWTDGNDIWNALKAQMNF